MSHQSSDPPIATGTPGDVPLLRAGRWEAGESDESGEVYNPSTGRSIARVPFCSAAQTSAVVEAAARAFPSWSNTPVIDRARVMFRYRELLEYHFEELAALITREHGKTLAESRAEVRRGVEMVEFACGIPHLLKGESLANIAAGVDADLARHPLGVCVGITPYNFPVMVPLWMFPVAIVCGNTFVLKPSDKVPLSAVRLGELLQQAGLPDGVFNIVHGGGECADVLLTHPLVQGVSFVGSTSIARSVYETACRTGKRVQAAGGEKNHLVVMPDADLDLTVEAIAASAFGCAGQRCMAGSVVVVLDAVADRLVEKLASFAGALRVGPTDGRDDMDMGPLIRREHLERVCGYLDVAVDEGGRIALDGRQRCNGKGFVMGPSVVDEVLPGARLATEEIFGPVLSVVRAADFDAALAVGRDCAYGNGASIFTRDGQAARLFRQQFNAGMIGINVGVPAPMAWFPFSGWNQSFFGDLHMQGVEGVQFYTRSKVTLTRWPDVAAADKHDPLWRPGT